MPELPEVETIRAGLARHLPGRRFTAATLYWPGCVDRPPPEQFVEQIAGRRIAAVERRGKYLILRLDDGGALIVHLRMTGRLRWLPPDAEPDRQTRAILFLDDGHELHFTDQRKFGRLSLVPDETALRERLAKLGPEPLGPELTPGRLHEMVRRRHSQLKPLLLDQRFLAGLGNIYVDEALFRARLHPLRRCDTLGDAEIDRLYEGVVGALRQGIANRGTTLASYRDAWGTAGRNQERLLVFRQQGRPCPNCGVPIQKTRVAGRGTHYCPACQPMSPMQNAK